MGIPTVEGGEAALVRRALAGETAAYAALVAGYRGRLLRYAVHRLGNREDAEEVVQDSFVRAYRSLRRCAPERFGAWLFGILVNRCRTAGARRARRDRLFVADAAAVERAAGPDAAERASWGEAVRWALGRLRDERREAFLLKYVEDLSYEEMAELTGASVSALKMRVKRACDELRALLREVERV
jgi:RNA polymerase sigma-70 factor (ECF subfamily)